MLLYNLLIRNQKNIDMPTFTHIVLTRFNVTTGFGGRTSPDLEWHCHRFDIFGKICYPSLRAQTNQNFQWLIFFGNNTAETFRIKIREYSKWNNIIPIYVKGLARKRISRAIEQHLRKDSKYLITTRLDNDDALHQDFIANVQEQFREQELEFINFPIGYVFCTKDNRLYAAKDYSNPFLSLIEKVEGFRGVWCENHLHVSCRGPLRQIATKPSWLQVVHGKNVRNQVGKDMQRVSLSLLKDNFSLEYDFWQND